MRAEVAPADGAAARVSLHGRSWQYALVGEQLTVALEPLRDKSWLLRCSCKASQGRRASDCGEGLAKHGSVCVEGCCDCIVGLATRL